MRNILVSILATNLVSIFVIFLFWNQSHKRLKGVFNWVITISFLSFGLFLILLRGVLSDWFSIILSNLLLTSGLYFGIIGFNKFLNRKCNHALNVFVLLIYFVNLIYFTFYNYNTSARIIAFSVTSFLICFQVAKSLFDNIPKPLKKNTRKVSIVFAMYCIISLIRIINELFFGNNSNDFFKPAGFEITIMLCYQALLILLSFNLILMFNQQLINDICNEEEKFSKAFFSSPNAILIIKFNTGEILDVNRSFLTLTGYTYQDVIGKRISEVNLWNDEYDRTNLISELFAKGSIHSKEQRFRKKTGDVLLGHISTELIEINSEKCILASFNDITIQKEMENALKESEKQMRSFVEFGMDAILLTSPDGRIFSANPAACEMFNYTEEEIIKSGRAGLVDLTDPRLLELLNSRQKNGKANGELTMIKKGGFKFPVEISSAIYTNSQGEKRSSMIIRDITERKIAEKNLYDKNLELVKAKEKAEESDKLKTAFLHTIFHEIRTPVNAIVGFSELLKDPLLTLDNRLHFIEIVTKSSYQLLSIINNIINVATIKAGQEKVNEDVTDINMLCKLVYNQYIQTAQEKKLIFEYSSELESTNSVITTDETKLIQILSNLVGNALKFTLKGSVRFGYLKKDSSIEFYVSDTGIGIAPELQDEIFESFRQLDYSDIRKFGGSGLGLTISKAYIEMLGGKIWLDSKQDNGTSFYFSIPYKCNNKKCTSAIIS